MSTTIRPETSKKNKYWIDRHRHYELKHFCLQYPIWKKAYAGLDGLSKKPAELTAWAKTNTASDPTAKCAEAKLYYKELMDMVERAAKEADPELCNYILKAVTEGLSYDHLKTRLGIPCCKDVYYRLYRRFFWLLSKARN